MEQFKLTIEEANMLDVLTSRSKMDSWFWIDDSDINNMKIIDLENNNAIMDTKEAILILDDGLVDIENDYGLTEDEIMCYNNLIKRIKEEMRE